LSHFDQDVFALFRFVLQTCVAMNASFLYSDAQALTRISSHVRELSRVHDIGTLDYIIFSLAFSVLLQVANYVLWQWPDTVLLSAGSAICSVVFYCTSEVRSQGTGWSISDYRALFVDFPDLVDNYMVGCFIFAGAIQVKIHEWQRIKVAAYLLCLVTNLLSTLAVGILCYLLFLPISRIELHWCFLLGAALSPTKPKAVTELLKRKPGIVPSSLQTFAEAEILLTDFSGILVFLFFIHVVKDPFVSAAEAAPYLIRVAGQLATGMTIGAVLATITCSIIRRVDHVAIEVGITFALVGLLNIVCRLYNASIPLAAVVAGIIVGRFCDQNEAGFSSQARPIFHETWALLDTALKSILFLMICASDTFQGLHQLGLPTTIFIVLSIVSISIFARFVSIGFPIFVGILAEWARGKALMHPDLRSGPYTLAVLTWGGMRGSISLPLVLGVPDSFARHAIPGQIARGQLLFFMAYSVVIFSACAQGLVFKQISILADDLHSDSSKPFTSMTETCLCSQCPPKVQSGFFSVRRRPCPSEQSSGALSPDNILLRESLDNGDDMA
jgi:monovalent cation:H+ antiporter, CPA1 family